MHPGTQMVKVHSLNEILGLIVALMVDKSSDLATAALPQFLFILEIQLNMVALKEGEPLGTGHNPFYPRG